MSLDFAILGFLGESDLSGYDLKTRCFDGEARYFWTADQAQIYRTLERLQSRGLVKRRFVRQASRPDRGVYSITAAGRDALAAWLAQPREPAPLRDPFLVQVYFSEEMPPDVVRGVLSRARDAHQERLDELRTAVAERRRSDPPGSGSLQLLTLDGAIANARATIDWIDDCLETVDDDTAPGGQRTLFRDRQPDRSDIG